MNEPKEGATTLKKKAQERLAAKSSPSETAVEEVLETAAIAESPIAATESAAEVVAETPVVEETVVVEAAE